MKVWIFRVIAVSIPVLFFILLEVGLRLAGYGQTFPLFIDDPANPHYQLPRPDLVKRYFAQDSAVPAVTMEANFLLKEKPANGLRVFVQGGSSAAGFPYGLGGSLAGMLDFRLKESFPDRYVEVVNTAMAAVNSYTLLDIADEIIDQQPDAVLIYAGHNEYLGILGVGSNYTAANSQGTTLLFLKVKELRTFQLLQQFFQWFRATEVETEKQAGASRTFMAKVAKHKDIALGSDLYQAGLEQFSTNLSMLLKKYRNAGVPVFLATIASNELDQAPFSSETMNPQLEKSLQQILQVAQGQTISDVNRNQLARLSEQAKTSSSADLHFNLGRLYFALGDSLQAQEHLAQARDLDGLRFRAPAATNQVIRRLAKENGAILVDVEQRLRDASPGKIIGRNLMLEHLHMNVQGYFLMADTFYRAMNQTNPFGTWPINIPTADAWKMRPLLPAEEYNGFAKVKQLMSDYPFVDAPIPLTLPKPADWQQQLGHDHFTKKLNWLQMMQKLHQGYLAQNDQELALKSLLLMAEAIPSSQELNLAAAETLNRMKNPGRAADYYQRAIRAGDEQKSTYLALIRSLKKVGQTELAKHWQQQLTER